MVRAGIVTSPSEWEACGYNEIQSSRKRTGIIDFERLIDLLGFNTYFTPKLVDQARKNSAPRRISVNKQYVTSDRPKCHAEISWQIDP
jgi:hypothetical protein